MSLPGETTDSMVDAQPDSNGVHAVQLTAARGGWGAPNIPAPKQGRGWAQPAPRPTDRAEQPKPQNGRHS